LRRDDFRWNSPDAPNTIGFFNPENNEVELIFELNSENNKENYAQFFMTKESRNVVNAWSPETASLSVRQEFCGKTFQAQVDVHRLVDGRWIRDYYTSQRLYTVVGPSCDVKPPVIEPPVIITPPVDDPPVCKKGFVHTNPHPIDPPIEVCK